jgi:hypothetical protein
MTAPATAPLDLDDPPAGPPKTQPLTAQHYKILREVMDRMELLEDAIQRAHHIGLNVGPHAAQHARDSAIVKRMLAMYPEPAKHPLAE